MCFSLNNITRTTYFTGINVFQIETFYTGLSHSKARLVLREARALFLDNEEITSSLRKHPFHLALRRWGRFKRPRSSPASKSEEKRVFSKARLQFICLQVTITIAFSRASIFY